jgi:multiple sugar transport system permease protein
MARAGGTLRNKLARYRRPSIGLALTLPALVTLAVTMLYPMGWTLWLSLNGRITALRGVPDFVWLDNYTRMATNSGFLNALGQTIGIVVVSFVLEAILALIVALALFRALKGTRFFQAIIALPLMVAPLVGALAWRFIFADGYGMIDTLAQHLGGQGPLWFANLWLARTTIVVSNLWLALPFDILVLLAGLSSLPTDPLEAARVDGASPLQVLWLIILPLLKPVISIIFVIRMADAFRIFDVVYVLTASGPANKTDVLSTFIYRQMFNAFDFPGGAAASILLVIITSLASLVVVVALRDSWQGER